MPQKIRIALDTMGGDHGPSVIVPGAQIALARHPDTEFLLYGDQSLIAPLLATRPNLAAATRTFHTDVTVKMDDKPSVALRQGRWKSSMWRAMDAVKKGEADVAVSAGNTGALMAMARFNLKMAPASAARRSRHCGRPCAVNRSSSTWERRLVRTRPT
jgi:Fatty acid/phospholipid biosynthesis enzyme